MPDVTRWTGSLLLSIGLAGCPGGSGEAPPPPSPPPPAAGSLIVGVQADPFGTLVNGVHVVVKQDGVSVHDETLPITTTTSALPKEIALSGPIGALVEVVAEALPAAGGAPLVTRLASSRLAGEGKKLLRVQLESRCVVFPGSPVPTCAAPVTCIAGACASPEVAEAALEDYEPGWAAAPPDICRPAKRGPPEVRIGTGQTDYGNLEDGQVLRLEKGPQGGHHVWIAARMRNLRQSGTTTTIRSSIVGDPAPVEPVSFVFTFEQDEGSFCKIWGLRYQVDAGASDLSAGYKRFLGKDLVVTVELKDSTGAIASSTKTIKIADKLLCPDGTEACNVP